MKTKNLNLRGRHKVTFEIDLDDLAKEASASTPEIYLAFWRSDNGTFDRVTIDFWTDKNDFREDD